jgi:nucleoside-diphosphate-sugar epimerase
MKILVTGGAGYIGSILVPELLDAGHEVKVIDSFLYRQNSLSMACAHPNFSVHRVDVRDAKAVSEHVKDVDVVIPLAALVGAPLCERNPVDAELVNLRAPLALFEMLSDEQIVIMPTTESVYGSSAEVCTEETPYNPLSTYGRHKVEVEQALLDRPRSVSLRLATVFGMSPRMRLDLLINDFTWRALRDRSFVVFEAHYRRTYVHVRDVARAFMHVLGSVEYWNLTGCTPLACGIYNVGAVHTTKLELCHAIQQQVPHFSYIVAGLPPKDALGRDPDQRNYIVSDAKIRATGFEPTFTLAQGITELLKGYQTLSNNRYGNMP